MPFHPRITSVGLLLAACGVQPGSPSAHGSSSIGSDVTGDATTTGDPATGTSTTSATTLSAQSTSTGGEAASSGTSGVEPDPWLDACPSPDDGVALGTVTTEAISEASGLVWSRVHANVLWTHNDSGHDAQVFALDDTGERLGTFSLGGKSLDWEDMAIGPGPSPAQDFLYLGDIGDNGLVRTSIRIYRVPEPRTPDIGGSDSPTEGVVVLEATYPDGPHDAETLLADPLSGDLFVVTKAGTTSQVFRWPAPQRRGETVTLEEVGTVTHAATTSTGGDISPRGDFVIVRTYLGARLWLRPRGTTLAEAFASEPCQLPLRFEPQGESIGIRPDGHGYTTLSEGVGQSLWDYTW